MNKKELINKVRNYIKTHKELQVVKVSVVDYEKASKEIGCDYLYIMMFKKYGTIY